jgi:uncharacterized protein (TIGR00730 family)
VNCVGVYCSASRTAHPAMFAAAETLGRAIAESGATLVYGGASQGPMGRLADAALAMGGRVIGVMPRFMIERGWGHPGLTILQPVEGMHDRKRSIIEQSDVLVALPGGTGTLEELLEVLSWKRLSLVEKRVIAVNVLGFFDPLMRLLEHGIALGFMADGDARLLELIENPEQLNNLVKFES